MKIKVSHLKTFPVEYLRVSECNTIDGLNYIVINLAFRLVK